MFAERGAEAASVVLKAGKGLIPDEGGCPDISWPSRLVVDDYGNEVGPGWPAIRDEVYLHSDPVCADGD